MKKVRDAINIGFWVTILGIPLVLVVLEGTSAEALLTESMILFGIGVALSSVAFGLRNWPVGQFRWNMTTAIAFFILYSLIAYPNLHRPGYKTPLTSILFLFGIALFPLSTFVIVRLLGLRKSQ